MNRYSLILATLLAVPCHSLACSVPVFRYALENWQPDRLTVAVLHDGRLDEETGKLVDALEAASRAEAEVNLRLHPIDVSAEHPPNSAEAFHAKQWRGKALPHMLVYFNNDAPTPQLAWSAEMNEANVDNLLSSPARETIVERLLDGQSAVWVLLKSGNAEADTAAEQTLRDELAQKPNEIELPSLVDLATEEKFNEELDVEMRVEFSVISIDPDDKQETFFREMLLNTESDLRDFNEPIAIPIYGRGRTYFALVGPGITADNIADNCNFICGACSCEVKRDNPGQDLLLAANWNRVQPGNWVNDTPLPELTGIGGFAGLVDTEADSPEPQAVSAVDPKTSSNATLPSLDKPVVSPEEEAVSETSSPASADQPNKPTVAPFVLLWGTLLFGAGLAFTIWQRRHTDN